MGIQFGTDEWIKAFQTAVNASAAYKKAAKKWEGDFYFIIEKGNGFAENTYLYMDLWHGEARDAALITTPSEKSPEFTLTAPVDVWKGVMTKKIDPIRGIMTKKLKLSGPMMKVMKAPKAAIELVAAGQTVETNWPL